MKTRACVLHAQEDLRIEERDVGEVGPQQVLVRIGAGGVCGSDIHYYWEGGIGTIRVTEPIVMGHEAAGTVEAVGAEVTSVRPGERIAISPSRPCDHCKFCLSGEQQHCLNMQFFGSAMRKPHCHGAFRRHLIAEEHQCIPVGDAVSNRINRRLKTAAPSASPDKTPIFTIFLISFSQNYFIRCIFVPTMLTAVSLQ